MRGLRKGDFAHRKPGFRRFPYQRTASGASEFLPAIRNNGSSGTGSRVQGFNPHALLTVGEEWIKLRLGTRFHDSVSYLPFGSGSGSKARE
jgi:hypothetical protein